MFDPARRFSAPSALPPADKAPLAPARKAERADKLPPAGASASDPAASSTAVRLSALAAGGASPVLALGLDRVAPVAPADWGDVTVADRQGNLKRLQSLARELKATGTPGIKLWSEVTRAATAAYAGKQLSPQRMSDFVMQDLAISLVGGDAVKYLQSYADLPWVRQPDPLVKSFFADWKAMGIPPQDGKWDRVGYAGAELDLSRCADFRPELRDGSKNQIYHALFYHFMAYTTQAPVTIHGGSLVHEFKDEGASSEDHNAAFVGIAAGTALRRLRDGSDPAASLQEWPALTEAAYGDKGGPDIAAGKGSPRTRDMARGIQHMLDHKPLVWKVENLAIDAMKHLKSLF